MPWAPIPVPGLPWKSWRRSGASPEVPEALRFRLKYNGAIFSYMPTEIRARGRRSSASRLEKPELLDFYRLMLLSRRLDDREIQLKRQNKIFFQISVAGHEAITVAAGKVLRPAYDWFFPYYRDRGLCLALGMTPTEMLLSAVAAADDPNSPCRPVPSHLGPKAPNILTPARPPRT